MMDSIFIRDLELETIIGTNPNERDILQKVIINLQLDCDLTMPSLSDELTDTVDYVTIEKEITELVTASAFFLVERLAGAIAETCLKNPMVKHVSVTIDKPGALKRPRSVAIKLERSN
jgi:FolB domain-containing protein